MKQSPNSDFMFGKKSAIHRGESHKAESNKKIVQQMLFVRHQVYTGLNNTPALGFRSSFRGLSKIWRLTKRF